MVRALRALIALLLIALPAVLVAVRTSEFGPRTPRAYDQMQAARYAAQSRRFGTLVVRPLIAGDLMSNADGSLPDFEHPPRLYTALAALAMRVTRQLGPGDGEKAIALLGALLLLLGSAATALLASRLSGGRGHWRAALLFAYGGGAMSILMEPHPALLTALIGGLLCLALLPLDTRSVPERDRGQRPPIRYALAAGALWGLLWLSAYSALLLLPVLLWHLGRVTRRSPILLGAFVVAAALTIAPQCWRAFRTTGDPFYHARRVELIARTESYPADHLYRATSLPRPVGQFLAGGGTVEVVRKDGRNLAELLPRLIVAIGPVALALFLASTLIRFADPRANRLRTLICTLIPLHAVGLSFFFAPDEVAPLFLLYAPIVAALGVAFLESVLRARRLPALHAHGALLGWTAAAILPGIAAFVAGPRPETVKSAVFNWLDRTDPFVARLRAEGGGILAASDAPETAFRVDLPTAMLPINAVEFRQVQSRTSKTILGFAMTPNLPRDYDGNVALSPWVETYNRIIGLWLATSQLPKIERDKMRAELAPRYPDAIRDAVQNFQPLPVVDEQHGGEYGIVFWDIAAFPPLPKK